MELTNHTYLRSRVDMQLADSLRRRASNKISSGGITDAKSDAGGYSASVGLKSKEYQLFAKRANIQNAQTFLDAQRESIGEAMSIVERISHLKLNSASPVLNYEDKENFNREYNELAKSLLEITNRKFNGISLFSQPSSGTGLLGATAKEMNISSDGMGIVSLTQNVVNYEDIKFLGEAGEAKSRGVGKGLEAIDFREVGLQTQVERITIGGAIADGDEFFLTLTEQTGLLETESISRISIAALASDESALDPQSSIRDRLVSQINGAAGTYLTASALGTNQISIASKQAGDPFLLSNVGSSGSAGSITQAQTVANDNNDAEERLVSIDFKHDTKNTGVALKVGDKISVNINGGNYEYAATQADLNAINGTVGDTLSNPQNYGAAALRMANGLAGVINAATATNSANVDLATIANTLNGASFQVRSTERGNDLAIAGTGAVTISQAEVLPTATTFNFSLSDPARTLKTGDRIQIDRDGSMVTFDYNGGGATGFTSWNDLAAKIGSHAWFQSATVAGNTMTVTATVEDINVQPNFRVRQIQTDDAGSVLTNPTHSGGTFVKQANWTNVGTTGGANSGLSLDLTVNNTNGQLSSVAVNTSGNGYVEGQTLSIPAGQLDGANSIQIRVDDVRGQVNGISGVSAGQARGSYSYNSVNTSTTTSPTGGSGATLNITSDAGGNITSANIVGGGTLYAVGDEFTVATADIGGGDANLATFQVTGVNAGTGAATTVALMSGNAKSNNLFSGITSTSNGAGTGGTFTISTNNDGTISGIAINGIGNNYRVGEEITIER